MHLLISFGRLLALKIKALVNPMTELLGIAEILATKRFLKELLNFCQVKQSTKSMTLSTLGSKVFWRKTLEKQVRLES